MGLLGPLLLALLGLGLGLAAAAETSVNASLGLEFSLGEFRDFMLNRPFPEEAILRHITSNVTFIIFQVHSQYENITISLSKNPLPDASGTGVDKGLVSILKPEQSNCSWYLEISDADKVRSVAVPLSYSEKDPIPGGCNLEFDLDVDPNIYLEYNLYETVIKFAPANLGYARGRDPLPCDLGTGLDSRWRLEYDVYQYFLPENNLTEEVLLRHMEKMSMVSQVEANGFKVATLKSSDKTIVYFSSVPGQGVIYNVIVRDPVLNTSAAYVPAHTYACHFNAILDNCSSLGRLSTKVFFTIFAILGLFICFFGHRFWKTELFFIGFIFVGFFFYILITRLTLLQYDDRLILTAVAGGFGGILLVMIWWRFGLILICMLCVGLVLGFFISSVAFFTPLGDLKIFHDDAVFWVAFSCMTISIPVVFIGCLRILNILTCGITGSYCVVLAIDSYFYTSLSYITLNVLKRAVNTNFNRAYTNVPFQTNDFVILAIWGMLAVSGITLQIRRERGRPFFPPHPYKTWKRERERRVTNILDPSYHVRPLRERLYSKLVQFKQLFQEEEAAGERTPLLL
ncbi:transmembrane 7 superfamily member 3 isoform X1 [Dromiciops gliroides]|uniref:transmembrane 7 superfamily member 3 isoform X1 n=1 Tax=Dromiciops gliroides TaxID=33562 RepID=UPI001CC7E10B|nr:transmembrane 7 superfamily member 3 isoform X1 [Dromiciops gliroides]